MLDASSAFLLCSNASPICPDSLCNESGFFKKGDRNAGTPSTLSKKDRLVQQLAKAEKNSDMIQQAVGALSEFIVQKKKELEERKEVEMTQPPSKKKRSTVLETMDEIERLAQQPFFKNCWGCIQLLSQHKVCSPRKH
jgi:hypothetical protein